MQNTAPKTIVVTGASSGIGRELAVQLAAPDRELWLVGRDRQRLDEVAGEVRAKGANVHAVQLDLSDLENADRFLRENFPPSKRVDAVYLAAAITQFGEVKDTLPEDWDLLYTVNLLSPIQWLLHFYGGMVRARAGRIVVISSLAAYAGYPTATTYATMKVGLLGMFRSLRHEAKAHHVSIHLASPGYVDTNIYKRAVFRNTSYEKTMSQIRSLGFRILQPDETACSILRSVRRGEAEFAMPAYASLMKWAAPRFPLLIELVHNRILKGFRKNP